MVLLTSGKTFKNPDEEVLSIAKSVTEHYEDARLRNDFLDLIVQL